MESKIRPLTPAALQGGPRPRVLPGYLPRYNAQVFVKGGDLYVPLCRCRPFDLSPYDQPGEKMASGAMTSTCRGASACALPMPASRFCRGTPLPQLPWGTVCVFTRGNQTIEAQLWDEGPAGSLRGMPFAGVAWPLWERLRQLARSHEESTENVLLASLRIVDGARFVGDYLPWGVEAQNVGG